jgi:hypothetical protein
MSGEMVGLIGGIGGSIIGLLGGLLGTYVSVRNTNGPKERAFMIRCAWLCCLGVSAFLVCLFLVPGPWRFLLWIPYGPALVGFIHWTNAGQARARLEDASEGAHPEGAP